MATRAASSSLLYCLMTEENNHTYIGVTNDFERRLRQHNQELTGGAKYTKGYQWSPLFHVTGFAIRSHVLQLEWLLHRRRFRIPTRTPNPFGKSPKARRIWYLYWALKRERFTKKAPLTQGCQFTIHWFRPYYYNVAIHFGGWPANVTHRLCNVDNPH